MCKIHTGFAVKCVDSVDRVKFTLCGLEVGAMEIGVTRKRGLVNCGRCKRNPRFEEAACM